MDVKLCYVETDFLHHTGWQCSTHTRTQTETKSNYKLRKRLFLKYTFDLLHDMAWHVKGSFVTVYLASHDLDAFGMCLEDTNVLENPGEHASTEWTCSHESVFHLVLKHLLYNKKCISDINGSCTS